VSKPTAGERPENLLFNRFTDDRFESKRHSPFISIQLHDTMKVVVQRVLRAKVSGKCPCAYLLGPSVKHYSVCSVQCVSKCLFSSKQSWLFRIGYVRQSFFITFEPTSHFFNLRQLLYYNLIYNK